MRGKKVVLRISQQIEDTSFVMWLLVNKNHSMKNTTTTDFFRLNKDSFYFYKNGSLDSSF